MGSLPTGVRWLVRKREPSVHRAMQDFPDVLSPALAEIEATYARYMFRPPSAADVESHLRSLRAALPDMNDARRAVREGSLRRYLGIRPLKLEMDIVNQCNLRCVMCHFSDESIYRRKKEQMPIEVFARVAGQVLPLCSQFSYSFGTEPLLHRGLGELLEIAGRYRVPWTYMHTNGLLLTERLLERMLAHGLSQISISIDGASAGTYEKIRVGARFERLLANIQALQRAKRHAGSTTPHLCFNVVLMRSNIEELPQLIRLAHDVGAAGVAAVHLAAIRGAVVDVGAESLLHHKALSNRVLEEARRIADALRLPVELPQPFGAQGRTRHRDLKFLPPGAEDEPRAACPFPWHFVGIDARGSVVPCGWWHSEAPMGNIHEQSFEQIWTTAFAALRAEHASGVLRPGCRRCPSAGIGSVDDPQSFAVMTGP